MSMNVRVGGRRLRQRRKGEFMRLSIAAMACAVALSACSTVPTAPRVGALPGTGKSSEQFQFDDADCRQYAYQMIGGDSRQQAANNTAVTNAVIGTAIGALAGAAINGSHGAGVGAGTGLVFGSLAGAESSSATTYGSQQQFDQAYLQCMYNRGHRIPSAGGYVRPAQAVRVAPPARVVGVPPPPPPGTPPPPPPGGVPYR